MTNQDTLALERQPKDEFLELAERFMERPDMSPEKLRELMALKFQWDAQQSEKEYWAAMIVAQRQVQALSWDKFNESNKSRNVSYPKIDRMLRPIREEHGFVQSFDTEPGPTPNMMIMCLDISHKAGHKQRYRLPMPIDGSGPKGGGVMSSQQAVGAGKSYGQRYLVTMAWDIPQLIDKDDNDGNDIEQPMSTSQVRVLRELFDRLPQDRRPKALKHFSTAFKKVIESIEDIPARNYKQAETMLGLALNGEAASQKKPSLINDIQVTTLQEVIEGQNCKPAFLAEFKIRKIGDLPSGKYADALKWLEQQRRK